MCANRPAGSRLAEAADRPRQALTAHGVDDQFARLSVAPPVY